MAVVAIVVVTMIVVVMVVGVMVVVLLRIDGSRSAHASEMPVWMGVRMSVNVVPMPM